MFFSRTDKNIDHGPNDTYLRTLDSILDRKLVTSASLKVVAPAKAGVKFCLAAMRRKLGPGLRRGDNKYHRRHASDTTFLLKDPQTTAPFIVEGDATGLLDFVAGSA